MNTSSTHLSLQPAGSPGIAHPHSGAGISTLELLLVAAMAALLLGLSVPSFSRLMHSGGGLDGSSTLQSSLSLARSKAREAQPTGAALPGAGQSGGRADGSDGPPEGRCSSRR